MSFVVVRKGEKRGGGWSRHGAEDLVPCALVYEPEALLTLTDSSSSTHFCLCSKVCSPKTFVNFTFGMCLSCLSTLNVFTSRNNALWSL